jgi:hypothetical protein
MILYKYDGSPIYGPPTLWQGVTPGGYAIARGAQTSAHFCVAGVVKFSGDAMTRIDAGLTLDEAFDDLTNGLTKADLVALGDDFGLTLSDSSLKSELLDAIRAHLEGLAT